MFEAIKKQIPNLFTLGNITCGVLAIIVSFGHHLEAAAWLMVLATVFDFFDGFLARLLKVSGELGKQLDSLADMVTFGVLPSILLFHYVVSTEAVMGWLGNAFLLVAVFSCYRLAKFNIDTRQSTSFIGVPTPITGLMCASWAFIQSSHPEVFNMVFAHTWVFVGYCVIISLLLVSEIPLPALKFKGGIDKQQIMLLLFAAGSIALLQWLAVPVIYCFYVLSSVIINFATSKNQS